MSAKASAFSECETAIPSWGVQGSRRSRNSHRPFGNPQRLVFGIEGFECHNPLFVPPLIQPAGHRPLQAVNLGFQIGFPGDVPLPPQTIFLVYLFLKAVSIGGRGSSRRRHLGVHAARAFKTSPKKFSTRVSIVNRLCNYGSN